MDFLIGLLLHWLGPILLGAGAWGLSNKVRGRNGQKALRYAALGFWFTLLPAILPFIFPILGVIGFSLLTWIPSIISFGAAGNSLLKEMRSQQRGDTTERAL